MSAKLKRDLNAQQQTIRRQALIIEKYRRAIENAVPMLLAGYNEQALKDLQRVGGGK